MLLVFLVFIGIMIFSIGAMWKIYTKAGQPGWACLVPFYNFYIRCEFCGVKNWWLIFIPFANIYIAIVATAALARSFNKDPISFTLGLLFLSFIFYPILGYGDAQYVGPNGVSNSKDDLLNTLGN